MIARESKLAAAALSSTLAPGASTVASSASVLASSSKRSFSTFAPLRQIHPATASLPPLQGPFEIVFSTLRTQGIRGLWLGQMGTLLRETGGGSAWFTAYEVICRSFLARRQAKTADVTLTKSDLKTYELMVAGAAAGVSYIAILFPADSIKSAIQTQQELDPTAKRLSFVGMGKSIWRLRGMKGLYAGCGMTCFKSGVSSAMIFALYETLQGKLGYLFD